MTRLQAQIIERFHYDPDEGLLIDRRTGKLAGRIRTDENGYRSRTVYLNGKRYSAARLIWLRETGAFPKHQIDHRDRNALNNRWGNLREASPSQNSMNHSRRWDNASGITGVTFRKDTGKWHARIKANRRPIDLGSFNTRAEAAAARKAAEAHYFGEFAPRTEEAA